MKKKIEVLAASVFFYLTSFASTQMCVKQTNGDVVKFDVENVEEVYYQYVDPTDTTVLDASDIALKFNVLSTSHVEVTKDFSYCDLETITIPEKIRIDGGIYTVTNIGDWAFAGFSSLTSIVIPSSVTTIGDSAFSGCSNLNVVIDNSKDKIKVGDDAFLGCKSVKYTK